ncbi:hypothetical protein EUU23_09395 [Sphingorhabdus sp. IMCC26285]|uniref:DUF5623 domain-containing protein n=1 Tax=Sphingorhabdus profundilacus TaxID=2509718 RepID=A0A6I4M1H3_9SPHN|nr:DUF5623 domain-containing protein [Sphingorhabdus profundilacus]MVZ97920.1 hypothetical protein [Sphingorhabdus profundilacus]
MPRKISKGMRSGNASRKGALLYNHSFAGQQFRPNGKMPIDAHQRSALIIKSVLKATEGRLHVENCLNQVRGNLDEYVMREYKVDELDQETFLNLYYDGLDYTRPDKLDRDQLVPYLEELKSTLRRHYPDGSPLRELLMWVDRAIVWIERWLGQTQPYLAKHLANDLEPQPRL